MAIKVTNQHCFLLITDSVLEVFDASTECRAMLDKAKSKRFGGVFREKDKAFAQKLVEGDCTDLASGCWYFESNRNSTSAVYLTTYGVNKK